MVQYKFGERINASPASADAVTYDNSISGLEATTVQGAVDTLKENLTQIDTYTSPKGFTVTRKGGSVSFSWSQTISSISNNEIIDTIPVNFRPNNAIVIPFFDSTTVIGRITVEQNGTVSFAGTTASNVKVRVGFSYSLY